MARIRAALAKVADALKLNHRLLARAQRRYQAFHKRAFAAMKQKEAAQVAADRLRKEAHRCFIYGPSLDQKRGEVLEAKALRKDGKALRLEHVEIKNRVRKQFWLGRVKKLQQRIHGLKAKAEHFESELAKNKAKAVEKDGNLVIIGGSRRERLRCAIHTAAHNCAKGVQNNYYSMSGAARAYLKTLAGMPLGHIWDCSTFADGVYICCDLPAPSGPHTLTAGGWTGTEGEHGKRVSESKAQTGDLVLYGPAPHHHVEVVDDPKAKTTIGHGSPPIDAGVFDLFGDGDYEIRSYLRRRT